MKKTLVSLLSLFVAVFLVPALALAQAKSPPVCTTTKADLETASLHTHFDQVANGTVIVIVDGSQKTVTLQEAMDAVNAASKKMQDASLAAAECAENAATEDAMAKAARGSIGLLETAAKEEMTKADAPATMARNAALAAADKTYANAMAPSKKLTSDALALATKVDTSIETAKIKPVIKTP